MNGRGGMHGRGGGMRGRGGMHGRECAWPEGVHGRGHAWQGVGMRGRHYEIRSMSGQYASYWNAFLFITFVPKISTCPSSQAH